MKRRVLCGIDNIESSPLLSSSKVGLITNLASHAKDGRTTIEVINNSCKLCALFAPEHGIEANLDAGASFSDRSENELTIYSLYGDNPAPTNEMLLGLDALVFDIQDVGARHYTYLSTLTHSMKACANNNLPFIVLDRPNPLGGTVNGEMLDSAHSSFVGEYPIPTRYGLTIGEYAHYINENYKIGCALNIVKISGWQHDLLWSDTDLEWFAPSPNIPDFKTCFYYLATCFLEATNLSEGRGTDLPFRVFGAPFLDNVHLIEILNSHMLPGINFSACSFTPSSSKFNDEYCNGIRIDITDFQNYDACLTKLTLIKVLRNNCPQVTFSHFLDNLTGRSEYFNDYDIQSLADSFSSEAIKFKNHTEQYLIYN